MFYECYNKLGEKIGWARSKGEAEEKIRHANLMLDLEQMKDPIKFAEKVERIQKRQKEESENEQIGLVAGIVIVVVFAICALVGC